MALRYVSSLHELVANLRYIPCLGLRFVPPPGWKPEFWRFVQRPLG